VPAEGIQYNPIVGMCVVTTTTPLLAWAWACAIVFEVTILAATCINAIDRPRDANQPLTRALRRDGIIYFALITSCRAVNLVLAATHNPNYAFVAI
jgi:cytosine/uracil/thiamine/allantoin permease